MVESLQGSISFDSKVKGTAFSIRLPLMEAE
jgi:signal transduction histidine kinase